MRKIAFAAFATTMLCEPAPASVIGVSFTVFEFKGLCSDCDGTVTGRLSLMNYVLGTQITDFNRPSFSYGGSNLYHSFSYSYQQYSNEYEPVVIRGMINSYDAGPADLYVSGVSKSFVDGEMIDTSSYFISRTDGSWQLGKLNNRPADYGNSGNYSPIFINSVFVTPVPEPSSWAMMVAGFGLAGAAMRRRRAAIHFA